MNRRVLMDTGPLVAYFCADEARHAWSVQQFTAFAIPVLTCEAVLAETCFLMARQGMPAWRLLEMVERGVMRVAFDLQAEAPAIRQMMKRYGDRPMSLADACLVRLAETHDLPICTLDSDFEVYRKHGRERLPLIIPRES